MRVVPMHTLSHSAVVAQGGGMLMGDFVHRCRESAAVVARRLVAEQFQSAGFLVLAGEELVDRVPQWLFVLAMCEMELPKANNVLHWERLEKLKGSPSWRHVIAANLRLCEFISPSVLKLERQLATGKAEQVLITDGSCRSALSWEQHAKAAGEALVELQCTFAAAAECASTESEAEQLWAWHGKIPDFDPASVPAELRECIPDCKGFVFTPFPCPHKADKTQWLLVRSLKKSSQGVWTAWRT